MPEASRPDERIHVVHVIGALQTGGAEKMLLNYLGASDRDRYRHTVLCISRAGEMADQLEALGVGLHVYPVRMRRLPRDVARLADWMRREQVRVVHSHMFFASFWGRLAARRAGVPVMITTEHGKEPWKRWWHIAADRWLTRVTHHHIAVSEDVRRIRMRRDGIPPERITMIPNGVPLPDHPADPDRRKRVRSALGFGPEARVVGTVGRVITAKAYPDLLQALGIARRRVPNLCWLQVGDGPELPNLRLSVAGAGLEEAFMPLGRRGDVAELLGAMDIWAMSSVFEGLPVALLEAMAAARPIATTDAGGITDAVSDEVEALVVPVRDPEAMAAAIVRLCDEPDLATRLGEAARKRAERDYGIGAVAARIEDLYADGLTRRDPTTTS